MPNSKITAVGLAGLVLSIALALLDTVTDYEPTDNNGVVAAVVSAVVTIVGYWKANVRKAPSDLPGWTPVPPGSVDPA